MGLMESILPYYIGDARQSASTMAEKVSYALSNDDIDGALQMLQQFLLTVPYCNVPNQEGHYQQILYIIFSLLGRDNYVDIEVRTSSGRIDMVMRTSARLYLFELKLNKSADAALSQIDLKDYPQRFALCGLPIVKVGINFDMDRRTIGDWKIESID